MPMTDEWHELVMECIKADACTLDELAAKLTKASGMKFGRGSVERFITEKHATNDILHAFDALYEIGYPILSARSRTEIRWFEVGQALLDGEYQEFDEFLGTFERVVEGMRSRETLKHRIGSGQKKVRPKRNTDD